MTGTAAETDASPSLDTDLDHEFEQRGLSLLPSADTPDLAGPFSVISFAPADMPEAQPQIAAAIASGDDLEPFDQAVAGIAATHPDLAPSNAESMATIAELVDTLPQPISLSLVLRDGEPIGVVARHADRRTTPGASGASAPQDAPAATGAEAAPEADPAAAAEATPGADPAAAAEATPVAHTAPAAPAAAVGAVTPAPIVPIGGGFSLLQDVVLEVSVELGRSTMPLARLMNLGIGSIVELDRAAGAPVDVRVNGTLFAHGEVVVVDDEYAVRILEILTPAKQ